MSQLSDHSKTAYLSDIRIVLAFATSIVMVTSFAFAGTCDVVDIQRAPSATQAAKDNFDTLVACIKDLQSRLTVAESSLHELPQNAVIFVTSTDCVSVGKDWVPFNPSVAGGHFIVAAGGDLIAGQARPGVDKIVIDAQHLPTLTTSLPFELGELQPGLTLHGGANFIAGLGAGTPGDGTPQPPIPITFSGIWRSGDPGCTTESLAFDGLPKEVASWSGVNFRMSCPWHGFGGFRQWQRRE